MQKPMENEGNNCCAHEEPGKLCQLPVSGGQFSEGFRLPVPGEPVKPHHWKKEGLDSLRKEECLITFPLHRVQLCRSLVIAQAIRLRSLQMEQQSFCSESSRESC
jgi:hypothetical protein